MSNSTIVLGIGNEFRSDDAVGIHFARKIKELNLPSVKAIESFGEGMELMELWAEASNLFVCDAVSSDSTPGTIHILDPYKEKIPSQFFNYSTHAFSLAEAIEMSKALEKLPKQVKIYGIEGGSFVAGDSLTIAVEKSLEQVVNMVKEIILK